MSFLHWLIDCCHGNLLLPDRSASYSILRLADSISLGRLFAAKEPSTFANDMKSPGVGMNDWLDTAAGGGEQGITPVHQHWSYASFAPTQHQRINEEILNSCMITFQFGLSSTDLINTIFNSSTQVPHVYNPVTLATKHNSIIMQYALCSFGIRFTYC